MSAQKGGSNLKISVLHIYTYAKQIITRNYVHVWSTSRNHIIFVFVW